MMQYSVKLSAVAIVRGYVHVEADSKLEAEAIAVTRAAEGDIVWSYDGVEDSSTIEVDRTDSMGTPEVPGTQTHELTMTQDGQDLALIRVGHEIDLPYADSSETYRVTDIKFTGFGQMAKLVRGLDERYMTVAELARIERAEQGLRKGG